MTAHIPRCAAFEECPDCFFAGSDKAKADLKALVEAAHAVLEGDSPCRVCGVEPGEGEGRCEEGCVMDGLVLALRPFDNEDNSTGGGAEGVPAPAVREVSPTRRGDEPHSNFHQDPSNLEGGK